MILNNYINEIAIDTDSFAEAVKTELEYKLGDNYTITKRRQLKNNSTYLTGLMIKKKDENIAPSIYLDDFYKRYKRGEDYEKLVEEIYKCYLGSMDQGPADAYIDFDIEELRTHIFFRLINRDRNEELLQTVPNRIFLDLAVTYHWQISMQGQSLGSVLITHDICSRFGLDEKALFEMALQNTPRLFPMKIQPMADLLCSMGKFPEEALESFYGEIRKYPLYVITNLQMINGAACLLYPSFKRELANRLSDGFYILPSSIHELIALPADRTAEELHEMVLSVNETEVPQDEFLSNNVYRFYPENGEIKVVINQLISGAA